MKPQSSWAFVAWILILSAAESAWATSYTVRPDGTGDFPSIQAAIAGCVDGDIIVLADGVFVGSGNRDINYQGKAVTVQSLSGDPRTCIIDLQSAGRGVSFFSGEGHGSVLQGVTITNGYSEAHGAGIWCHLQSSPTISNCIVASNHAKWTGAGLYCFLNSSPVVDRCVFYRNRAEISGGGAHFDLGSSPVLSHCTFYGNSSPVASGINGDGYGEGVATLTNCIVAYGVDGEAVWCGNRAVLTCCDLYGNEGGDYTGCLADQYGINGNISAHPLFCDPADRNLMLQESSPCAPFSEANPACDLIGARPVACPAVDYVCCMATACRLMGSADCVAVGGNWLPGLSSCDPNPCLPYACCLLEECQLLLPESCAASGGLWMGAGSTCDPNPCLMDRYVVRPDGSGDFPTIQAAVDGVSDRSIIELADGAFTGSGNRDVSYRGKAIVIRSQGGDPDRCIIDCGGSDSDPHTAFAFASRETRGSVLRGVTIVNGRIGPGVALAINVRDASPQILGNVFVNNGIAYSGTHRAEALVEGNLFRDFDGSVYASCISVSGVGQMSGKVAIRGNTFRDLSLLDPVGPAVDISGTGDAVNTGVIENNHFENMAGSAVVISGTGNAINTGIIRNNHFENMGSAISLGGTGWARIIGEVRDNLFVNCAGPNAAVISMDGTGEVSVDGSLSGNTIVGSSGTAISVGGISGSQFHGDFRNNTIVGNSRGIVRGDNVNDLEIYNTILWQNGDDLLNVQAAEVHCSDTGDGDFEGINGNFSEDPLFCDAAARDYGLREGSPCAPLSLQNPECGLIGARPQGCAPVDPPDPPSEPDTAQLQLLSAVPNPSTGATVMRFSIPAPGQVSLRVYTLDGREVAVVWDGPREKGRHSVSWDGCDGRGRVLSSGVYFVRLVSGRQERARRIHLIR